MELALTLEKPNKLGDALRLARAQRSIEALAEELEVSRNTLGDYERGVRAPEVDFLVRFAEATGADLSMLLGLRLARSGANDELILKSLILSAQSYPGLWQRAARSAGLSDRTAAQVAEEASVYRDVGEDFVLVRRRGLLGSAGPGAENVVLEPKGAIAFRRDWLEGVKGVRDASSLIVAEIEGDSMVPTFYESDLVVFKEQNEVTADDIYLFCLDGRLFVKRLSYRPGGAIEITSDNTERYARFELGEKEAIAQRFEVKGRFFWRGGDRLQ
jgi:phage repressor protein C with HTH and peptisase S24 domain/DNA-binding XRE family transcriptional regulator